MGAAHPGRGEKPRLLYKPLSYRLSRMSQQNPPRPRRSGAPPARSPWSAAAGRRFSSIVSLNRTPLSLLLFQNPKQFRHPPKEGESANLAKARGALAIAVLAWSDDGNERNVRVTGGEGIINVVSQVERCRRIALSENFLQSFRMRLPFRLVHRDNRAKVFRSWPFFKRERKFLPCASGKKIQLEALRPFFNLPRRDHQLFVSNVPRLAVAPPIEFLKRRPRLLVRSRVSQRTDPRGNHAPVVVKTRFAFPPVQLRIGYPLARYVANRLERRTPVSAAYINEHAVHIEDQDLDWRMFSCGWHGNIGAETGEPSNLGDEETINEARAVNNRPSFTYQVSV